MKKHWMWLFTGFLIWTLPIYLGFFGIWLGKAITISVVVIGSSISGWNSNPIVKRYWSWERKKKT